MKISINEAFEIVDRDGVDDYLDGNELAELLRAVRQNLDAVEVNERLDVVGFAAKAFVAGRIHQSQFTEEDMIPIEMDRATVGRFIQFLAGGRDE